MCVNIYMYSCAHICMCKYTYERTNINAPIYIHIQIYNVGIKERK